MADVRRLVELSMVPPLAKEVAAQIDAAGAGVSVTWDQVTGKPATFAPVIGTTATTAMAGNTPIPTPPVASAVIGSPLAAAGAVGVSTAYARADHVHAIPGASAGAVRGTVLIQAAQANSVAADIAAMVVDFNALLAKLRTAGILTP